MTALGPCREVAVRRYIKVVVAAITTVIAALAISYLEHLSSTGAGIAFGFFSVVSISEASCSLSTLVAAAPLGLFILFDAPPLFIRA